MKLNTNTMVPKIIAMSTEVSIVERMSKLQHFDEEIESVKECLIDVFDGYGKK